MVSSENVDDIGIKGVLVADTKGKCLLASGMADDVRIRAIISDSAWLKDAAQRRFIPILLTTGQFVCLVSPYPDGYVVLLSSPPADTVLQFIMGVDFAYDILNHILNDPYDAMTIVDKNAKMAYISPVHEKFFGLEPGGGVGKNVRDVIENTRLHLTLKTEVAEVGQVQRMKGFDRVVSRYPIQHGKKVVGAIGRVMFKGPQQLEAMARKIRDLEGQIKTYKSNASKNKKNDPPDVLDAIIGNSLAMRSVRDQIRKIAPLDIPVLIQGESGTGKELVAQALHHLSARKDKRLVTVNAAALPASLVESELFGYEAGSFTGADRKGRAGKFEQADQGTIFLDEIGDMPLEVQTKLLRVLQDRMVERVGGDKPKRVDFRLCSATNRDLEAFVEQEKFRLDLFYRISPVCIHIPPLDERREDIPLLLNHFVSELANQYGRDVPEVEMKIAHHLMERSWPGNVRQLRHVVERAFVFAEGSKLTLANFEDGTGADFKAHAALQGGSTSSSVQGRTLKDALEELELQLINDAVIRSKGNKKKAAEHLGVSRSYLYKKLEAS
ncbi:sigma 54-interacting transcriptional regulator [Pseudooceanicola sp.]|uniref:sigma-54 interaction domain-containing protein n=1 Tax=Pseudooceanicola sp. TaxID=1914328 RepID=UPI00261B21A8|nr:sigma 54-interacting transcriptional regulator [Pseudooceanicola sp.]MDF1856444.1 sigma 54-interacting transcriptional regulator [Pseudooceanicola sp.]